MVSKSTQNLWQLRSHITGGTLVHQCTLWTYVLHCTRYSSILGVTTMYAPTCASIHTKADKGKDALAFSDLLEWSHDSNPTLSVLLCALSRVDLIPKVLHLQLDNCYQENKNKFVLGFSTLLPAKRVFRKVFDNQPSCNSIIYVQYI